MPNYNIKIDCQKIDKAHLYHGKKGTYLDVVLIETEPSSFGDDRDENTHVVIQSVSKKARDKGIKGPILGNAKPFGGRQQQSQPSTTPKATAADMPPDNDEIPF